LVIKTESASQEHFVLPQEAQMMKGHPVILVEDRASMVLDPTIKIVGIIVVLLMVTIAMKDAISNRDPIGHKTIIVKAIMALTGQIAIIKTDIVEDRKEVPVVPVVIAKIIDHEENMVIARNMDAKAAMNHVAILTIAVVVGVMTIAAHMISVLITDHVVNMEIAHNMVAKVVVAMTIMNVDRASSMIEVAMANKEQCARGISGIIAINKIIAVAVVVATIIAIP
jgi:hypothetical protein